MFELQGKNIVMQEFCISMLCKILCLTTCTCVSCFVFVISRPAKAPRIDIFFCIATKKRSILCSSKRIDGQDHPLQHSFIKCRLLKIPSFTENVLNIFFQRFSFNFFRHSTAIYNFRPVENAVPFTKRMSKITNLR